MNRFIPAPIELFQSLGSTSNRCIAAIAYVTKDWLELGDEDLLICDASDAAICTRRTDRLLLRSLVDKGVQVYSNELLHSKLVVFDYRQAFVGSANMSLFAAQRIECGVLTSDRRTVEDAVKFILRLRDESRPVDVKFLERIDQLALETKRAPKLSKGERQVLAKMRQVSTSVAAYWFFKGTKQLSSKAQNAAEKLKTRWESTVDEVTADEYDEVPEDLDPLDFHTLQQSEERWKKHLCVGDKVFWCYEDSDWGWIVLPPRTVVSKREYGGSVLAGTEGRYWDFENSIYREQFLQAMSLPANASLRRISADDEKLQYLLANWDVYVADSS
ncbi:MAG: phospholipase D family protein [Pirellulaceae bacterium]